VPSADKAKHLLGFTPRVDLNTGLKKTIAWCRAHFAH
jgi:nucleoside-diphosphate-sugar epimerase